jgi:hypothetical protein
MMQSKAKTVAQYLAELPPDRRKVVEGVRKVIRANLDRGFEEGMQYGMIGYYVPHRLYPAGYHCNPAQPLPFACLASQKNYLSLYLTCIYASPAMRKAFEQAWRESGKKLDMGKSCIRFKKLEDLAIDVIGQAIARISVQKFITGYEAALAGVKLAKKTTTKAIAKRATKKRPAAH